MLAHLLSLPLLLAPPADDSARSEELEPAEFGELETSPDPQPDPGSSASGGYGTLAPLPSYNEGGDEGGDQGSDFGELEAGSNEANTSAPNEFAPKKSEPPVKWEEPEDFGPFFEPEPVSEVKFPGDARRDRKKPFASVAGGMFCFVEDSACGVSLIADADVGVGLNVITSDRGLDVPYTQFRVRGGLTLRPLRLAAKRWHPWGVGVVGSWSLGSGSITATSRDPTETLTDVTETDPIRSWRVALLNQIWFADKRNALHLDITLGGVNSSVLNATGRYWGTHAEVALGFGGWGGLYMAGDFLDSDTRVFIGMRGHGIATGPLIALIVLGLVAGGVAL
ncbi:MAG: hypothetical protein R6X02_22020 [Enhygromyxa sp.]